MVQISIVGVPNQTPVVLITPKPLETTGIAFQIQTQGYHQQLRKGFAVALILVTIPTGMVVGMC
jgi:hypothetical protein